MEAALTFPEEFAKAVGDWIPALSGRVLAVSEVDPFKKETMPSLPVAIVAVIGETYEGGQRPTITTDYVVEVMLPPKRETKSDGCETPFWTFVDYTAIRDRIFAGMQQFGGVVPVSTEIEADELAVYISIRLQRTSRWCEPELEPEDPCAPYLGEAEGPIFVVRLKEAPGCEPEPECEKQSCEPCWMDEEKEAG